MFEGKIVVLKTPSTFLPKPISVFIMLFSTVMDAKPFSDTGDGNFGLLRCSHNHGSRILQCVGISARGWDSSLTEWKMESS